MTDRHTNVLIFQLLKLLNMKRDKAFSFEEVKKELKLEDNELNSLIKSVESNARIEIFSGSFRFRPLYKFANNQELETGLRKKFPEGIKYEDIKNEVSFLELPKNSPVLIGNILFVEVKSNFHMLFYNDTPIPKVDNDLKVLWNNVVIPDRHIQPFVS